MQDAWGEVRTSEDMPEYGPMLPASEDRVGGVSARVEGSGLETITADDQDCTVESGFYAALGYPVPCHKFGFTNGLILILAILAGLVYAFVYHYERLVAESG